MSDSWLGKFRTILYLSIVYCIGSTALSLTAFPGVTGTPPSWWGMAVGLGLLSIGTGGIKVSSAHLVSVLPTNATLCGRSPWQPCVSAFGGDQFHPSQIKALAMYFSVFYFSINAGSVLSMLITPILRQDVHW